MTTPHGPSSPAPAQSHLAALLELLARLRHAHRGFMILRLSWLMAVAALAAPLVALSCVHFAGNPYLGAQVVLAGGLSACLALLTRALSWLWPRLTPRVLATFADTAPEIERLSKLAPNLGSSVASAVALGSRSADGARGSLVEAHLAATRRAADATEPEALLLRLREGRLRPWRRGCARLVVLLVVAYVAARQQSTQVMEALRGVTPTVLHDGPLWADVEVSVQPPAYSRLPPLPWAPMGTQVRALVGSTVALRGRAEPRFTRGLLALGTGAPRPWQPDASGLWQVQTTLTQTTAVEAIFINNRGVGLIDATQRTLVALPDEPPSARIAEPQTDVVLKDHEQFVLTWQAEDDLGLGSLFLRITPLTAAGEPQSASQEGTPGHSSALLLPLTDFTRSTLGKGPSPDVLGPGEHRQGTRNLSARALGLTPGPGVQLDIEARDTAPEAHVAHSAPLRVTLFSERAHHEALLERQQQALHTLVDWLALELGLALGPTSARPLSPLAALMAQVVTTDGLLQQLTVALANDVLSDDGERLAMQHVARHASAAKTSLQAQQATLMPLSFAAQRALWAAPKGAHCGRLHTLEGDILYLDNLLAHGRLDILHDHVKDLLAAKAELQDLIARYRQTGDDALKAQMGARMAALKQQVQDLLGKMAALRPALSEGFHNDEAQNQDPWDQTMRRLDQAMDANDVDALAQDLEHMANMVDNAAKELQDREDEAQSSQSGPLNQELQQLAQQLQELQTAQQNLNHQGAELARQALEAAATPKPGQEPRRHAQGGPQQLQQALDRIAQHIGRAEAQGRETLPLLAHHAGAFQALKHSLDALQDAAQLLRNHALPETRDRLQQSLQLLMPVQVYTGPAAAPLRGTKSAMAEAQRALEELLERAAGPLPPALQRKAQALQSAQQKLQGQVQQAQQSAEHMSQDSPVMGDEATQELGRAQQAMGQAAAALGAGGVAEGQQQQQAALDALRGLQQALQQAGQASDGGAGGMPRPMGKPRPRPHNSGGSHPSGAENPTEVAIPKAAGEGANGWREQLMDYAKQAPPQNYEEPVRRYYDELMR